MFPSTKPCNWGNSANNLRSPQFSTTPQRSRSAPTVRKVDRSKMDETNEKLPPVPPPRPQRQTNSLSNYGYNSYTPYGGHQSNYNYGGYGHGGYGGYSGYNGGYNGGYSGGYSGGYNSYNTRPYNDGNNQATSSFVEEAEQNSRVAFDSIHSIVQAFGSVAMMFESTFFALHSSFRAVLGVADHFSRLRHNLVEAIGSNFIVRWLRNIVRRILVLIRLRNPGTVEEIWSEVKTAAMGHERGRQVWGSWPLLLFFGVVLGTPWLIWKFLSSFAREEQHSDWMTGDGDHVLGKALYDFEGEGEDELSFCVGDCLRIAPKEKQPRIRGWLLAAIDETTKGIVPANYIKILGLKKGRRKATNDVPTNEATTSRNSFFEKEYNEECENDIPERTITDFEKEFEETTDNLEEKIR